MNNRFLADFMRTQNKLVHDEEEKKRAKRDHKGRKTSKHGTASGEPAFGELTLDTLIAEKPPKKDILEYFRDRIAKLVAEEMENA